MAFVREPMLWLLGCAVIGYLIGRAKGMGRAGFFLGLVFGPIGWGILVMLPYAGPHRSERPKPSGPACPRCGKPASHDAKACPHCGNVLVPIHYTVDGEASG